MAGILSTKFLRAAVEADDRVAIFSLPHHLLKEEEEAAFDFVKNHLTSYATMPDIPAIEAAGFEMGEAPTQPPAYYRDRLVSRAIYNSVNELHPDLKSALQSQDTEAVKEIVREMSGRVAGLSSGNSYSLLSDDVGEVVSDYLEAKQTPGIRGVTLGWDSLDAMTLGAMPGEVITVVGRPNMGKSWVMLEMAYKAWESGKNILFVTMEMGTLQVARRLVGRRSRINPNLIRSGTLSNWGEDRLFAAIADMEAGGSRFKIMSGDFNKDVGGVEALAAESVPDVVYIDAAYLLSPSGRRYGQVSKWEQLSGMIAQVKQLALRIRRPIVISVQFNRNVKRDTDKRPDLGDVGGTDSFGQDSDIVLSMLQGRAPFEKVRRVIDPIKHREGAAECFEINFTFDPVDFSEVEVTDAEPDGDEEDDFSL